MSIIENSYQIIDLFIRRNHFFWYTGLVLFIIAIASGFVIHALVLNKENVLLKRIKDLFFWFGLIGFVCILLSFAKGMGIGFGNGTGILGDDNIPTTNIVQNTPHSAEEIIHAATNDGELYVRVYGKKIYVAGKLCQTSSEMTSLVEALYKDNVEVVLLDDYAEFTTYMSVKESLNGIGIHPSEISSTKGIGDNQ